MGSWTPYDALYCEKRKDGRVQLAFTVDNLRETNAYRVHNLDVEYTVDHDADVILGNGALACDAQNEPSTLRQIRVRDDTVDYPEWRWFAL